MPHQKATVNRLKLSQLHHPISEMGFSISAPVHIRCSSRNASYTPNSTLHRHAHHEILIIEKGGGTHIIDYQNYDVVDNQVFFLRPGQVHQFKPDHTARFYFIAMDEQALSENTPRRLSQFDYFRSFNTKGFIVVDDLLPILEAVRQLEKEIRIPAQKINQNALIVGYLWIILIRLQQAFFNRVSISKGDHQSEIVTAFNQLIDDPIISDRFVREYAKRLHISPNYLNECVKISTGKSASYWIQKKQVLEAKRALKQSDESIEKIAKQLGFKEVTHFSRFFKTITGESPRVFRKK